MAKTFSPPSLHPPGPMLSPISVQGPDEQSLHPDQLRASQETGAAKSSKRREMEMQPKASSATIGPHPASAGFAIVIALGGILVLLSILGFLGIRLG